MTGMNDTLKAAITSNFFWFTASLVVAVMVWFVAKIEANPISQELIRRPIILVTNDAFDESMVVTFQSTSQARVIVSAQESTLAILEPDDVTVTADVTGLAPGRHTIPLDVEISRLASSDTQPTQITVEIESRFSQQVPVEIDLQGTPINYIAEITGQDVFQAVVSGATSRVSQVVATGAIIELEDQQTTGVIETQITLQAFDINGVVVDGVTITPAQLTVDVTVSERENIRIFNVRPDIDFSSLPDNFEFRDVDYEPTTVILDGNPEILDSLGNTIDTMPISLEDRSGDFTVEVPLDLPEDSGIVNLSETSIITVEIFINEEEASLPVENIPVRTIGGNSTSGRTMTLNPTNISVVLTGPVSTIEGISAEDVQAIVDLTGLDVGTHSVAPRIEISQGQIVLQPSDILLIPSTVTVNIVEPQPEVTESPETTPEAELTPEVDG